MKSELNVSNYLDAFLIVYGWSVYYVLFLLICVSGFFLYPLLKGFAGILTEYLSGGYRGMNFIKQALITLGAVAIIYFLAIVPVVEISLDATKVGNICGAADKKVIDMNSKAGGGSYFSVTKAHVPILPWIAMRLGQGMNGTIYSELPCALDITDLNKKMLSLSYADADKATELDQEYRQFARECTLKAGEYIQKIRAGEYDNGEENGKVRKWFNDQYVNYLNKNKKKYKGLGTYGGDGLQPSEEIEKAVLYFDDSEFLYEMFYSDNSPMKTDATVSKELGNIPATMHAQNAIPGFSGENGLPKCGTWWREAAGDKPSLKNRLIDALSNDMIKKVASDVGPESCRRRIRSNTSFDSLNLPALNPEACKEEIEKAMNSTDDEFRDKLLSYQQGNTIQDSPINGADAVGLTLATAGAVGLAIVSSIFHIDLASGLIGSVVSFYGGIWIFKLMLKFLIPMVFMTACMFWGLYIVLGEMRASTLIKGMLLLFSLSIIPGLWFIMDHLDDRLFEAMHGGGLIHNPFEMLLLDAASGMFYFLMPMVVFYMQNLAGVGDPGQAFAGAQREGQNIGKGVGGNMGQGFGKGGKWLMVGDTQRNPSGGITRYSGGFGAKMWGGVKGRWKRFRGKNP
ncbi:MAG: hypothetical protein Q4A74_02920 [Cardiobacteriaceae bacterium]|nr:hypothetical protein [Cardiobacteriaceae bacterium]